ncbi:hypothetical protein [Nocardioides sp. GY 10127]|uniref:hypothetical protein n=1 Tax=Nocardioides sp. GY 10127 TaxID=2569762 RepID=UPI0010A901EC|nr:hypothetical protein [Nocardioides sp. GY 10127]TIC86552.1 hypothetical protein E8D37_01290 [Nocardioides sp. GY 10127]
MNDEQPPPGRHASSAVLAALPGPLRRPAEAVVRDAPVRGALALACAGLALQVVGYVLGWAGHAQLALWPYYLGLVPIIAPFAALLTSPRLRGRQRFAAAQLLGLTLWASWFLSDPVMATRFDETLHVRTLLDLLDGDGLFTANTMLPVSPYYPGLELATAAVHWTTGLPVVASIAVVDAGSRALLVAGLFALGTLVGRFAGRFRPEGARISPTLVGGTAVLLYAASPQFYFFNAQFAYQTPALGLLVVALALLLRGVTTASLAGPRRQRLVLLGASLGATAALTVTHHLTSWLYLAGLWFLVVLLALEARRVREDEAQASTARSRARTVLVVAEVATLLAAAWTTVVAPLLVTYLGPIFETTGGELWNLLTFSSSGSREVLADSSGNRSALWEIAVMGLSILLWCALLAPSLWGTLRGSLLGRTRVRWLLLVSASAYPAVYAVRFFPTASEVADRATTFVCLATALVAAVWLVPRLPRLRRVLVPAALVMIIGGIVLGGGPDWQRVPGPYLPGAEQRSVDAQTVAVARWAGEYLPAGSRIASDLTMDRVIPDFAPVDAVTQQAGDDNLTPVFTATSVDDEVLDLLVENKVDFLVVDERIIGHTVLSSSYFEAGSSYGATAQTPTREMMTKFAGVEGFDVVYDSGGVVVYDVRSLRGETQHFADRADPGLPGDARWWQTLVVAGGAGVLLWWRRRYVAAVLRRPRPQHLVTAALLLPGAMLVGLLGLLGGYPPVQGALVLGLIAVGAVLVRAGRADPPAAPRRPWAQRRAGFWATLVAVVLLAVAGAAAGLSAYHGLTDAALAPSPETTLASTSGATSGSSSSSGGEG